MPDIRKLFDDATVAAKSLTKRLGDEDLLQLYALYQQATIGDVQGDRPGLVDLIAGAKHDAWAKLEGMSRVEAMQRYIARVNALKPRT